MRHDDVGRKMARAGAAKDAAVDQDDWFRAAYPRLRRFAAVVAPPTVAPDDLVQDALVRLLRHGLADVDDAVPYLCRTMANLASDRRRRWRRGVQVQARVGPAPQHSTHTYPSDLSELSALSSRERGAVYLHDVEGMPFDDVAALLGCTPAAARQAAVRGRRNLRDEMEASHD